MKGYEKYKNINLLWLKTIPEHWDSKRAKTMFEKVNRPVKDSDDTVTCFRDGVVTLRKNRRTTGFTESMKEIGYQGVRKGDLVIHQMDAFAGAIGVSDSNGKSTPVYSVCIPKSDIYSNYYYAYIVREMAKTGFIQSLYRGIRERSSDFRFDTFGKQYLPIPPRPEQDQIVKFLDFKISKINKFIKDKKREIELLKEQIEYLCYSQSEISKTITSWDNAFDHNWKLIKAKRLFDEINIKNCSNEELLAVTQDRGVVYKKECTQNYVSPNGSLDGLKLVRNGDFVISLRSFQGGIEYSFCRGIVSPAYNVFCLNPRFNNDELKTFYRFLFKTKPFIELLKSLGGGIRDGKNISFSVFSQFYMPIPSEEQLLKISAISQKLDLLQKQKTQLFNLMNEYKASLISDVLTGKVDVRNINIDEIFEQESLDEIEVELEAEELTE
jgi:type I restriction enzyme, S subunit